MSLGIRLKKQLELNLKDGEKVKVTPVGEVVGLDGRKFKIDAELLLKSILENDRSLEAEEKLLSIKEILDLIPGTK